MDEDKAITQALSGPISRRRVLQGSAIVGVSTFLAACGGGLASPSPSTAPTSAPPSASGSGAGSPSATPQPTPSPTLGGTLHWANWPAYIDLAGAAGEAGQYAPGSSPTTRCGRRWSRRCASSPRRSRGRSRPASSPPIAGRWTRWTGPRNG